MRFGWRINKEYQVNFAMFLSISQSWGIYIVNISYIVKKNLLPARNYLRH